MRMVFFEELGNH